MRYVVCPACHETIAVPDELAEAFCPRCAHPLTHSETHVAAGAPPGAQAIQAEAQAAWSPSSSTNQPLPLPAQYADWDEFRDLSPALQGERIKLAMNPLPDKIGRA